MNSKELIGAALKGAEMERNPVAIPYYMLACEDRYPELMGEGVPGFYDMLLHPERAARYYEKSAELLDFDIFQPVRWRDGKDTDEFRDNTELVELGGSAFYRDRKTGALEALPSHICDEDNRPVETQSVFDRADAVRAVKIVRAEEQLRQGRGRYIDECVRLLGKEKFILAGGVLNVFYLCSWYVGLTNLFCMTLEQSGLIDYLSGLLLEQNIERIRMIAACGGDAVYIDDAMSGNDMIGPEQYERFCLPYVKEQVSEIHRQGKKAFVIYYGGIADRIEQIVSTGADALVMESTMKSYVNDYGSISDAVNDRMCVFTNLNAYGELELPGEAELETIVARYAALAKRHRKYVISTGSPVTPGTSMERLKRFAETARMK